MAYLLEPHGGEDILDLTVQWKRVELVVVEVAEASTKAMLLKLQHWLRLGKRRKVISPGSCYCQVAAWRIFPGALSHKARVHMHRLVVIWCATCYCCEYAPSHFVGVS
jgi:hypothetical protein